MKITIDMEVLKKENLTLGEFLILLMGFKDLNYDTCYQKLVKSKLVEPNLFSKMSIVLSDNTKKLVEKILLDSDDRITNCGIDDFEALANKLRELYPDGNKAGTTYSWRSTTEEIAQKLKALVVVHNFTFTEEEAIEAVKDYISSFNDYKYMSLLKYFILRTWEDAPGHREIDSMFMTIIENNREGNG